MQGEKHENPNCRNAIRTGGSESERENTTLGFVLNCVFMCAFTLFMCISERHVFNCTQKKILSIATDHPTCHIIIITQRSRSLSLCECVCMCVIYIFFHSSRFSLFLLLSFHFGFSALRRLVLYSFHCVCFVLCISSPIEPMVAGCCCCCCCECVQARPLCRLLNFVVGESYIKAHRSARRSFQACIPSSEHDFSSANPNDTLVNNPSQRTILLNKNKRVNHFLHLKKSTKKEIH